MTRLTLPALLLLAFPAAGCSTAIVEPGHRGLLFDPGQGGLRREVLPPGKYALGACFIACTSNRIDDFDVTYSTKAERLEVQTVEGLALDLGITVIYRPIVSELYQLDTEIGRNYYDEVIGPEVRSVCRGVLARRSYVDLRRRDVVLENEIEAELRSRIAGKHVEISAVTLERIAFAPEVEEAIRKRVVADASSTP